MVLNPGLPAPAPLFNHADTILQYENPLSNYQDGTTIATFTPWKNAQTAIFVHTTTSTANVRNLVHGMATKGIQAVYFGVDCCYHVFSKDLLDLVASAVLAG